MRALPASAALGDPATAGQQLLSIPKERGREGHDYCVPKTLALHDDTLDHQNHIPNNLDIFFG